MKKALFLALVSLAVLNFNCATQQPYVSGEKCDAPVWNVGDTWRFVYSNTREWEYRVVGIEEDFYVVDDRYGAYKPCFNKKTFELVAFIDPEGRRKLNVVSVYHFDFPLHVGKTWKKAISGIPIGGSTEANYLNEFRVVSYEPVKVSAGTFESFKIELKQTNLGARFASGKAFLWYSPEVKFVVKLQYEKIPYWGNLRNFELVSFKQQGETGK
jgi:hypothetical protein